MKQDKKSSAIVWDSGVILQNRGVTLEGVKGGIKNHTLLAAFMQLCVILLCAYGSLFTFTEMFNISYYPTVLVAVVAVLSVLFLILYNLPTKVIRYTLLALAALFAVGVLLFHDPIFKGAVYLKDEVIKGIFIAMYWSPKELSYAWKPAMKTNITLVLALIAALLTFAVSYFTVRKISFLGLFLVTFPFFEIGAAFGAVPPHLFFALMLGGWTASFAMYAATRMKTRKTRRAKREKGNKEKTEEERKLEREAEAARTKSHLVAGVGMTVALITVGSFLLTNVLLSTGGFTRTENLARLRLNIKDFSSNITDLVTGIDHDGSLKEGKLYELGDSIIKNRPYLTVEIPKMEKEVYLKGFVGGKYTGNRWEQISNYESYSKMFSDFSSAKMYPQQFGGELLNDLTKKDKVVAASAKIVTISKLRRKKDYAFMVYNSLLNDNYSYSLDLTAAPKNKSSYSYTSYINNMNTFKMNLTDLFYQQTFASLWKQYGDFVEKEYLTIPDALDKVEAIVSQIKVKAQTDLEIADFVRDYLAKNTEYSFLCSKVPEGKDFTEYFLFNQKKGYSAHYATAAAILLRAAGIPTRYVEGYLITDKDYATGNMLENGNYKFNVTDKNAHAWVEVYQANYGWIPIEVTPGFYTGKLESFVDNSNSETTPDDETKGDKGNNGSPINDPDSKEIIYIPPPVKPATPKVPEGFEAFMIQLRKVLPTVLGITSAIVVSAAAVLLFLYGWLIVFRQLMLARRKRFFTSGTTVQRTRKIYKYFNRLLKYEGLYNKERLLYLDYASEVGEKSEHLDTKTTLEAMELFLKSKFSDESVSEEEVAFLIQFVTNYSNSLYQGIHGKKKWRFKYLRNLG